MKRLFTSLCALVILSGVMSPAPVDGINLKDFTLNLTRKKAMATDLSEKAPLVIGSDIVPLKSPKKASMERKSVILFEEFNDVPDGGKEQIDNIGERYADLIASSYYDPRNLIPNEYTPESGTWYGDWVFAGEGGTVVLQCYNPMVSPAKICTPMGDFSGDITVTVKARARTPFFGANNDVGYVTGGGSSLDIQAFVGGYGSYDSAVTDMDFYGMMTTGQIYQPDGWQEITFKFRNESPNADGFLSFSTTGAIEIDWIKVTDDNTFLACPKVRPTTNFTNDGFTINWDPVRRSYNYYIDLYKQVYTADGLNVTYDFNDGLLPEGAKADKAVFVEGEGVDGSTALMLGYDGEGAAFETPNFGKKLGSFTTMLKFEINDEENYGACIIYDVLDENGWQPFGYLEYDGYWTTGGSYYPVCLDGPEFENQFYAVRFYTMDLSQENKVYIDDINAFAPRPFELVRVEESMIYDPDDDDFYYNFYAYTDHRDNSCTYTFSGLDPETEYWYRVRSHNVSDFSMGEKYHAFGVAAPKLGEATNVSDSSYTANWTDAAKAQSYIVSNYSVETAQNDNEEYTLLSETFANCQGEMDIDLMEPLKDNINELTDLAGWSGTGLLVGQNMLGVSGYLNCLTTPPLPVNPSRGSYYVFIDAYGYSGDYLYIMTESGSMEGYMPFDEDGCVSGWLEFPDVVMGERIQFFSYNFLPIGLAGFEVVQAVEKGDRILTFVSSQEIPAGVQSCTFSNLTNDRNYAFGVVSKFNLEKETAVSVLNDWMYVDMATGQSLPMTKIENIGSEVSEAARFTIDGRKATPNYKGVVLVKMSDGSVVKKVEK